MARALMPLGIAGIMPPGDPGSGGSGIAGGGEGSAAPGCTGGIDLRCTAAAATAEDEAVELVRASANAAASGESESLLKPVESRIVEVTERRFSSVS